MRKLTLTVAAAAMAIGTLTTAPLAQAAQTAPAKPDPVVYAQPKSPVQALDCQGTTGNMGCGPGWFWRDGWKGWGCYVC
jgi:hypothetical protein